MSEPTKYRKKPVVIEAMQLTLDSAGAVARWLPSGGDHMVLVSPGRVSVHIKTLEGVMVASVGDFIIRGVQNEFYPCKPDIFAATYEAVSDV